MRTSCLIRNIKSKFYLLRKYRYITFHNYPGISKFFLAHFKANCDAENKNTMKRSSIDKWCINDINWRGICTINEDEVTINSAGWSLEQPLQSHENMGEWEWYIRGCRCRPNVFIGRGKPANILEKIHHNHSRTSWYSNLFTNIVRYPWNWLNTTFVPSNIEIREIGGNN